MTLSIRNTLRSLSLLAVTTAFLPGCDSEEYEALGLSSEELDAMSEEELDELAAREDYGDLEHSVDPVIEDFVGPLPPTDPGDRPDDLTAPAADGTVTDLDTPDTLWDPYHTHNGPHASDIPDTLWDPYHTHNGPHASDIPGTLWDPYYTHGAGSTVDVIDDIAVPVRPTHGQVIDQLGLPDPGCKLPPGPRSLATVKATLTRA